jgi:signal transduction histidine kinase
VLLAALMAVIAFRSYSHGRGSPVWKSKAASLDGKLSRMDALMGAYPGLAIVWDGKDPDKPARLLGSTAALASMRRYADKTVSSETDRQILAGLTKLDVVGAPTGSNLLGLIRRLREKGHPFSVSLILPDGGAIDATGRVAGAQAVLWLDDPSLRTEDESEAIRRLDANRSTALRDPLAFIEMLDRAGYPAWRVGRDGEIRWVNPAYVSAVGARSLADVLKNQTQLDSECAQQAASVLSGQPKQTDTRAVVVKGKRRSLAITLFPVSGGAAGVAVDATEADTLRSALISHIRAHDETLNALTEGVVIFGPDQKMRFHNTAFSQIFGLDESWYAEGPAHGEWLDRLREDRVMPEQADYRAFKAKELDLYTNWPSEMPEEIWPLPDGRMLRVVRQRDPEGGLLLLFADMTDQMTLKSQLGTLINVQKTTLDRLSEGIAVFGTDGRLRLSNRAFAKIWSLNEASLEGHPRFQDLLPQLMTQHGDRDYWNRLIARVTDPDPDVRRMIEDDLDLSDGRYFTWLSRPLPDGATLIAFEDRTQSKQAEDALMQRNEALEQANRIKSEFVGHVSYQLRTPLTTIAGYAELLQSGAGGELSDKQSEYLFSIESAADELKKSINDILDIAAIEANVLDLELGDVDVFALLDNTLDYVATRAEETKIQVHLDCPREIGMIRADERRLKQVVYNLLLNALRFTKSGGHIQLGAARADGGLTLWVKDTGVGIPTERQPRVFESFQSSRGGTGLGLALVLKFIERHGGWVELQSEEGKGTHVTCYLPTDANRDSAHPELDLAS